MNEIIALDSTPIGLLCLRPGLPLGDRCKAWVRRIEAAGGRLILPEIAAYETRRELIRIGSTNGLRRLDNLKVSFEYLPITTPAMELAAELWALVRKAGTPTAHPHALDGDCILAAQVLVATRPGEAAIIAASNVAHLARFPGVDARLWETIA